MSREAEERGYHHGDLPGTLLKAALASIAENGVEQLSLRALARQAGVSATAPYRHFPSKRCLLAALMTQGFARLERAVGTASAAAGDDPVERLLAAGLGYIRFARDNPTAYNLMFSGVIDDFSEYAELQQASQRAYAVVLDLLEDVLALPGAPPLDVSQAGGVTWAAVHGLASLLLYGHDRSVARSERDALGSLALLEQDPETALRLLMRGIIGPR